MNQKTAVYSAISEVKSFEDFTKVELSKDEKATVKSILVAGFEAGEIELTRAQDDLNKYVNGLIGNWLRKDKRLNGGVKHEITNPGSRAGQGDAMVKNLRILLSQTEDETAKVDIQAAIDGRLATIKPATAAKVVDPNEIPEDPRYNPIT